MNWKELFRPKRFTIILFLIPSLYYSMLILRLFHPLNGILIYAFILLAAIISYLISVALNYFDKLFKPTVSKIILTLILILIFPVPHWTGVLCERCDEEPCPPCPAVSYSPASINLLEHRGNIYLDLRTNISVNLLFFALPVSYLISCLLVCTYKRFKKT